MNAFRTRICLVALLIGCSDGDADPTLEPGTDVVDSGDGEIVDDVAPSDDATAGDDTAPVEDATPGDDVGAPELVELAVTLLEFGSGTPIANQAIRVNGEDTTTDENGLITREAEIGSELRIELEDEDFPTAIAQQLLPSFDERITLSLPSNMTIAGLAAALGLTIDPEKAVVLVSVLEMDTDNERLEPIAGVTIDLTSSYDIALRLDSASPVGISPGNTTAPDSISNVIFVNVELGALEPTFVVPNDLDCSFAAPPVPAQAGQFIVLGHRCE